MGGVPNYEPVLAALSILQSNVQSSSKTQAHKSLEEFQKSVSIMMFSGKFSRTE